MELFDTWTVEWTAFHSIPKEASVTSHTPGAKPVNGNEKNSATAAKKAAESTSEDIQDDLHTLQEDVVRLSQQLAKFASAKGNEAWNEAWGTAKDNLDDVLGSAKSKGREAADAVGEVRDNLANAIDESIEKRPYTTLALALAMGFVVGAIWKR
jgi:ElaB/YqjD/DUF883 family membrane-anchored ribosome-binding protein